jgi:hypothetical protein
MTSVMENCAQYKACVAACAAGESWPELRPDDFTSGYRLTHGGADSLDLVDRSFFVY